MKILYFFAERSTPMYQWQRIHFFDELSRHGIQIEVFNPELCQSFEEAQEKVVRQVKNEHYDLFMTCYSDERKILRSTLEDIKQCSIPRLLFTPDNLSIPYFDRQLAASFDLVWLTAKETRPLYEKWGAKTFFAPYAANPFTYKYKEGPILRSICFIGTPHGSRAKVINKISRTGVDMDLFFGRSDKGRNKVVENIIAPKYELPPESKLELFRNFIRFSEGRSILAALILSKIKGAETVADKENIHKYSSQPFDKMIEMYSSYALSLSFSSYGMTDIFDHNVPVVNLRNFEIPMCGGIQFCRYSNEMAEYYEDGKEIVLYRNDQELSDKVRYYINNASDQELQRMKQAARLRSENENTWMKRFDVAFKMLGLKNY